MTASLTCWFLVLWLYGDCSTTILAHPTTVHGCARGEAVLRLDVRGQDLSYQWFKDDSMLVGETSAELRIDNAVEADEGRYQCEVRDTCNQITRSRSGWLFISPPFYKTSQLPNWRQNVTDGDCRDTNADSRFDIRDLITLRDNDDSAETCQVEVTTNLPALRLHSIYRASSADAGETFLPENALLLDAASVPDAIFGPDNALWVYYVSGTQNYHSIWVARLNEQDVLEPYRCVTLDGDLVFGAVDPDIIRLRDGRYRLFYYSNFGPPLPGGNPHFIETAVSNDGIHFTREGIILETDGGTDPSALQHSSGTNILAVPVNDLKMQIAINTGEDDTWVETLQLDTSGIPELVERENGDVLLIIGQPNGNDTFKRYLSSNQGQSWTQLADVVLSGMTHDPATANHPGIVRRSPTDWELYYVVEAPENN
ncbi:hypothetical protein [Acanthopleuribacter pedis]|uniref:Ig-like domain-containing protein n=1 Tax=Acanthopleuribacter pedis TaxID=442870 RepID=A0A8J7U5Q0_9BACT|nr:hypothetical protein [Acanthopleuribacter pedis]MBO1321947.1 hypothetical protein [Acanthopleuribacter pedis]